MFPAWLRRDSRVHALAGALLFGAASIGLSWPGYVLIPNDEKQNLQIAYNLAKYGAFSKETGIPEKPFVQREPGHPLFLLAVLAGVPSFLEHPVACISDNRCGEGRPVRRRLAHAEMTMTAAAVVATFLAAFLVCRHRRYLAAFCAGLLGLALMETNLVGNALVAILLLAHALLLFRLWRHPALPGAVLAGLALALGVLTEAVLQYWLVLLAVLCAVVLWRASPARRAGLRRPFVVMLLAAALPVSAWMVRNYAVAGEFVVAGRQADILTIRGEYATATWSEIGGMFAFHLPLSFVPGGEELKRRAMDRFRPGEWGYVRIRDRGMLSGNPEGFYPRAAFATYRPSQPEARHSVVAKRADLIEPGWRDGPFSDRAWVLQRAAVLTILENFPKHLAVSGAMALWGHDHTCRAYRGIFQYYPAYCGAAKIISFFFIPAALALLVVAARRRDMALAFLTLPALYFFFVHAFAAHFVPRLSQPAMPLLIVIAAFAAGEALARRTRPEEAGERPPAAP